VEEGALARALLDAQQRLGEQPREDRLHLRHAELHAMPRLIAPFALRRGRQARGRSGEPRYCRAARGNVRACARACAARARMCARACVAWVCARVRARLRVLRACDPERCWRHLEERECRGCDQRLAAVPASECANTEQAGGAGEGRGGEGSPGTMSGSTTTRSPQSCP
jgi:hypothetical protein